MARKLSMLAPDWWDFTTLDDKLNELSRRKQTGYQNPKT